MNLNIRPMFAFTSLGSPANVEPESSDFAPVKTQEHYWGQSVMLGEKVWLTVAVPVRTKDADIQFSN